MHKAAYNTASKKQKSEISRYIVEHIKNLNPPGRFIKTNPLTGKWEEVSEEAAREKAAQVLRDAEVIITPSQTRPDQNLRLASNTALSIGETEQSGPYRHPYSSNSFWTASPHSPTLHHSAYLGHYTTTSDNRRGEPIWQEATPAIYTSYNITSYFHRSTHECAADLSPNHLIQSTPGSPHIPMIEPVPLSDITTSPWSTPVRSPYRTFYSRMSESHIRQSYSSPRSSRGLARGNSFSRSDEYRTREAVSFHETTLDARYNDNYNVSQPYLRKDDYAMRCTESIAPHRSSCDRGRNFEQISHRGSFQNYYHREVSSGSNQHSRDRQNLVTPYNPASVTRWHQHDHYFSGKKDDQFS